MHTVYEFRPLPDYLTESVLRYADGLWLPDDGEYDLAFIGKAGGVPYCLYVDIGYRENIICSWTDVILPCSRHPYGNLWHYALKAGATGWGDGARDYEHPNRIACDAGMSKMSSLSGCCNGRSVSLTKFDDMHISGGLVRNSQTKEEFKYPDNLVCMYCGQSPGPVPNVRDAIARHVVLKRLGDHKGAFRTCDCLQVVREQIIQKIS